EAARIAIQSPLLETSINGAHGVIINITGSLDIGLDEVETAAEMVREAAHEDANIIFGAAFDPSLEDEIRVTVIATGFEGKSTPLPEKKKEAPAVKPVEVPADNAAEESNPFSKFADDFDDANTDSDEEKRVESSSDDDDFDAIMRMFQNRG
ncbi:MAG: cell division protein FtsZ, partial [Oscillospiraceae bacterium]|nr:cell division protein FtsZ [Oscillospiraceae bacterium]